MTNTFFLPKEPLALIHRYFHIKLGRHIFPCPYYQNVRGLPAASPVLVGKGLPDQIEQEALRVFSSTHKHFESFDKWSIRLYMTMAGLGIDCSGFVVRVLDSIIKNYSDRESIAEVVKQMRSDKDSLTKYTDNPYTKISADDLTNTTNSVAVNTIDDIIPGDLIRFGPSHVAIISCIEKDQFNQVKMIEYFHSTSDYRDMHGVRKGTIDIINPNSDLAKQRWNETLRGRNWSFNLYLQIKPSDRGVRRLNTLVQSMSSRKKG